MPDPITTIFATALAFKTIGKAVDATGYGIAKLFKIPTKEEQAAKNAENLEKMRQEHAFALAEAQRKNAVDLEHLRHQYKIKEREAIFQNDLIKMRAQAEINFESREYEALQKTFPLRETTENFRKKLLTRLDRCASRAGAQGIPAPNLFLMLPENSQRFLFFDTLEFSQFTSSLRMLTSSGTYSTSGRSPYFNHIGAWQQSHEFQNFNSVQTFWEVCSFYPTIIIQPCYSQANETAQLNVYYWDINSQETQEAPNHLTFGEMSIDEYRKQLFENVDAKTLENGEYVSHLTTRGMFLFYRLMTATAIAQFIDGYYYRANGTLPQFLPALKESFAETDVFQAFPCLQRLTQDVLLSVLNDRKFAKSISNFENALEKIRKPGFFYQGEERLASWTSNILQDLKEEKTVKHIAESSIYLPY